MMSRVAQEMAYDKEKILLGKAFREVNWQSSED
jgi:hypothetical protein